MHRKRKQFSKTQTDSSVSVSVKVGHKSGHTASVPPPRRIEILDRVSCHVGSGELRREVIGTVSGVYSSHAAKRLGLIKQGARSGRYYQITPDIGGADIVKNRGQVKIVREEARGEGLEAR